MRVVVFGGTDLSLAVLEAIEKLRIGLAGVVHVGEDVKISYAPEGMRSARYADVAGWAEQHGVPALEWDGQESATAFVRDVGGEFGLAAGWYHMLGAELRDSFAMGCAGLHASLLPRLRGGAPLNWAILSGATETGVSMFMLGAGVDDGPLLGQRSFAIGPRATIAELVDLARDASLELVREVLPAVAGGTLKPTPQVGTPTYGQQRRPEDGRIEWSRSAEEIDRLVRAVGRPYPGAFTYLDGEQVTIWAAEPMTDVEVLGSPGQLWRSDGGEIGVVTGSGVLMIRDATGESSASVLDALRSASNRRFDGR
jgi:methionyl-tRNA formyltransferase